MLKKIKLNKITMVAFASAVTILGAAVMSVTTLAANPTVKQNQIKAEEQTLSLPGAGMGNVIEGYVGATSGSSVELLSTTALGASLDDGINEYYDENGNTIGKLIVYTGSDMLDVFDKVQGTERIETGDDQAEVIGHFRQGDVATLVRAQGDWYQVISDSVNGYVKKDDFARGVEAEKLDQYTYIDAAFANSDHVNLYAEDYDASTVLCVVPQGVRCSLVEVGDELSKISVPGVGEGWVYNSDAAFGTIRRYASTISYEEDAFAKIADGIDAANGIEKQRQEDREKEAAEQAAQQAAEQHEQDVNNSLTTYDGDPNLDSVSQNGAVPPGTFVLPLNGHFSCAFGNGHKGVDYWCGYGDPIWASCAGVVIEAGWSVWGYGNYVLIQHDDHYVTRYAHMSSLNVTAGQYVNQYDIIGFAGSTGDSTGVHCHFELLIDGVPYDPLSFCY